jgi:predicted transcriptional regulator
MGGMSEMNEYQMGVVESKFADIIWENEPIASPELAKKSEEGLKWKKSTTYTVLKRLCDKGIFQNNKGVVTSLVSKDKFYSLQSEKFIDETFSGSLPAFLTAFTSRKKLTAEEVAKLQQIVDEYKK